MRGFLAKIMGFLALTTGVFCGIMGVLVAKFWSTDSDWTFEESNFGVERDSFFGVTVLERVLTDTLGRLEA
jgi:hypothetical protein